MATSKPLRRAATPASRRCIVRKATLEQWADEWQRLVASYNDRFRFLPTHDPALPSSFSDARTSTLRRLGNVYLGTIDALLKHANDFQRAPTSSTT